MKNIRIIIITGLSGSGKSVANRALEDLGFMCVDNLPVGLLPEFLEMPGLSGEVSKLACVMDSRGPHFFEDYQRIFSDLQGEGYRIEVLFMEASDEVILRRFSETRRPHPLALDDSVAEGIERERKKMAPLREVADYILDTSTLSVNDLRKEVINRFSQLPAERRLTVFILSFGFKYGIPPMADVVMDVRFLPNPFFLPELKDLTGEDPRVAQYVMKFPETREFMDRLLALIRFLVPFYVKEGKSYLTLAIGCTGGRHRSVAIANELAKEIGQVNSPVKIRHRDVGRNP